MEPQAQNYLMLCQIVTKNTSLQLAGVNFYMNTCPWILVMKFTNQASTPLLRITVRLTLKGWTCQTTRQPQKQSRTKNANVDLEKLSFFPGRIGINP